MMSRRMLVVVLAFGVVTAIGALVYVNSTPPPPLPVEDCEDKPAPKDEFAMAAECDAADATPQPTPVAPPAGGQ